MTRFRRRMHFFLNGRIKYFVLRERIPDMKSRVFDNPELCGRESKYLVRMELVVSATHF